ncbi:hypothetical protein HU200_018210 [Digitaria exilis]|uniref:O-methyltransferase n=1 Tax=Digitaria exilis TaxID=1010633 RepID=A0A835F5Z8_9POAL|nr:hypothetical protein HU200_018210 [Digitaria exilis]
MSLLAEYSSQELLQAHVQLWHQSLGFFKSAALAIALDLQIADAIHRLGGAATLPQILSEAGISPCRLRDLRRVMRVLTVSGIFSVQRRQPMSSEDAVVYKLTAASHLLVRDDNKSSTSMSLLPNVHLMLTACRECPWIMHDWSDDECVKILKNCKRAIPPRDAGGKVIIIDMVMEYESSDIKHVETQVLYDLLMMNVNGVERDEQGWKTIFFEAGFNDYKIIPVLGVRSIIELYP